MFSYRTGARALARQSLRSATQKNQHVSPLWRVTGTVTRAFSTTQQRPIFGRTMQALRVLRKQDPILMPVGMFLLAAGVASFAYIVYMYTFYYGPIEHSFPEPVAKKLKRALYYTTIDPNLPQAMRYFQQALQLCEEEGMNPFSEQVVGIRIRLAAALEHGGQLALAARTLDALRDDLRRWTDAVEGRPDCPRRERTRILKQLIATSVKLGQLYADPALDDLGAAERHLEDALETSLREQSRRERENVNAVDEGDWLTAEETGATLEELAYHFDRAGRFNLSAVLFLRALTLSPPPCHAAMIMNNLATSIAQSAPSDGPSSSMPGGTTTPPTSRDALLQDATAWARKALDIAGAVPAADRVSECDVACATATHNLGEFAEMAGAVSDARHFYENAHRLAKAAGFSEGTSMASQALKRLNRAAEKAG